LFHEVVSIHRDLIKTMEIDINAKNSYVNQMDNHSRSFLASDLLLINEKSVEKRVSVPQAPNILIKKWRR